MTSCHVNVTHLIVQTEGYLLRKTILIRFFKRKPDFYSNYPLYQGGGRELLGSLRDICYQLSYASRLSSEILIA